MDSRHGHIYILMENIETIENSDFWNWKVFGKAEPFWTFFVVVLELDQTGQVTFHQSRLYYAILKHFEILMGWHQMGVDSAPNMPKSWISVEIKYYKSQTDSNKPSVM